MTEELFAPLYSEWGRRVGWGAMILFGLLLIVTLFRAPFIWQSDWALTRGKVQAAVINPTAQTQNTSLIKQIPGWHLFGNHVIVETDDLPVTSLQLRLVGIITAEPSQLSRVIISDGGQPGNVYQVGDSLPSGIRINAITQDGVILDNAGRLEKLPLQRPPLSFQGMPKKLLGE